MIGDTEISLGTMTMIGSDNQPLDTADSDLKLSLGFLDSGVAGDAEANVDNKNKEIAGEKRNAVESLLGDHPSRQ